MNAYRLKIIQKEFPFVKMLGFKDFKDVDSIKINRGDKNLMHRTGYEDSYTWCGGGYLNYTKFYVVFFTKGVWQIVCLKSAGRYSSGSGKHQEWEANTIGEQLFNRIVPDYIVEIQRDDVDANGNGRLSHRIVIYKTKISHLLSEQKHQIDMAAAQIKKELEAVYK